MMEVASESGEVECECVRVNSESFFNKILHRFLTQEYGEAYKKIVRETVIECKRCNKKVSAEEVLLLNEENNQKSAPTNCAADNAANSTFTNVKDIGKPNSVLSGANPQSLATLTQPDFVDDSVPSQDKDTNSVKEKQVVVSKGKKSNSLGGRRRRSQAKKLWKKKQRSPQVKCELCLKQISYSYFKNHKCIVNQQCTSAKNRKKKKIQEIVDVGNELVEHNLLDPSLDKNAQVLVDSQVDLSESANDNKSVFTESGGGDEISDENNGMPATGRGNHDIPFPEKICSQSNSPPIPKLGCQTMPLSTVSLEPSVGAKKKIPELPSLLSKQHVEESSAVQSEPPSDIEDDALTDQIDPNKALEYVKSTDIDIEAPARTVVELPSKLKSNKKSTKTENPTCSKNLRVRLERCQVLPKGDPKPLSESSVDEKKSVPKNLTMRRLERKRKLSTQSDALPKGEIPVPLSDRDTDKQPETKQETRIICDQCGLLVFQKNFSRHLKKHWASTDVKNTDQQKYKKVDVEAKQVPNLRRHQSSNNKINFESEDKHELSETESNPKATLGHSQKESNLENNQFTGIKSQSESEKSAALLSPTKSNNETHTVVPFDEILKSAALSGKFGNETENGFKCPYDDCNVPIFTTLKEFKEHIKLHFEHNNGIGYKCNDCKTLVLSLLAITTHISISHPKGDA